MFRRGPFLVSMLLLAPAAGAQLPVPRVPALPVVQQPLHAGFEAARSTLDEATTTTRELRITRLLRNQRATLERDPRGAPILRSVILALAPTEDALHAAIHAGFVVQGDESFEDAGLRLLRLLAPRGLSTAAALDALRRMDPAGTYDFDHLYSGSATTPAPDAPKASPPMVLPVMASRGAVRVGLVDDGVMASHKRFVGHALQRSGCEGRSKVAPGDHGTAVADLIWRAAPQAALFAADVYCGDETGGRADAIVRAMAWFMAQDVAVANLSLVGPDNRILAEVVRRALARQMLVVAAVGNDGPRAPPLYPAAYPGVIGVTATDARERVIFEALRGPQVQFAAPGADMTAAVATGGDAPVRGTSFAAPLVAGLLAARRAQGLAPQAAIDALATSAKDLGAPGRDEVYGVGLVGAELRK